MSDTLKLVNEAELELKSHHFFDEQIKILKPKKR